MAVILLSPKGALHFPQGNASKIGARFEKHLDGTAPERGGTTRPQWDGHETEGHKLSPCSTAMAVDRGQPHTRQHVGVGNLRYRPPHIGT